MGQRDQRRNQREIRKYLETDKNITHQNLWNEAKAVPRRKFIVVNITLKKNKDLK